MKGNPFIDDRDSQATLDIGLGALTTGDRDGEVVTGSSAFQDDRDTNRGSGGNSEQLALFSEEERIDGQQDLFGGSASTKSDGFFDVEVDDGPQPLLSTVESDLGGREIERAAPAVPWAAAFDVSMSPEEAFEGVGATSSREIGGFDVNRGRETDRFDRERSPPGFEPLEPSFRDPQIESNIAAADAAGVLSGDPNGDSMHAPEGLFDYLDDNEDHVGSPVRSVDLEKLDIATEIRQRYPEHLHESDHRGRTTVVFKRGTPDAVINQAELARDEIVAETARSQTDPLTSDERARIKGTDGFSRGTTTANWRSAKGVFAREGLSDQFQDAIGSIADYDDPIEGAEDWVSRHKQRQSEARVGGVGGMDVGEEDIAGAQRAGRAAARELQSIEEHAISGAKAGKQAAIDALVLEAGWDRSEARALAGRVDDPRDSMTEGQFMQIVDAEIKRSRSSGRFAVTPTRRGPPGVDRRRNSGRFVSSPLEDTRIGRNTATGRFVSRGER